MATVNIHDIRPNINYHKFHDCMLVVVQRVMYRVFVWLYTGGSLNVGDFLKTTERGMKLISAKERATLEEKKIPGLFDITLLYKILQHTCNLADDGSNIWHKPASPSERESLEHTLYILKEERNRLSHEPQKYMYMKENELQTKLSEIRRLCTAALQKAGDECNRTGESITVDINRMLVEMSKIENEPIPSGFTPEKLAAVAAHEIRSRQQALPFASGTFVAPRVHLRRSLREEETSSLQQLLKWRREDGAAPGVICVWGDTGVGKTSLCQQVFDSWISVDGVVSDLQECDLVIPVHCCDVLTSDLARHLKSLLEGTIDSCGPYEFLKLLKSLRILWLVDGYDEATGEAVGLLKYMYEERGRAHTILVTSRPQDSHTLMKVIPSEDVCDVILSGMTDEGFNLLIDKLSQENADGSGDWVQAASNFKETLGRLGPEVMQELRNPLKLILAQKLWKNGTLDIEKGGTLTQLYAAIQKLYTENLCSKIGGRSIMTEESISRKVEKWVKKLCHVAYDMTLRGEYILVGKSSQKLLEDESDRLQLVSEYCLSTFLMCKPGGKGPAVGDWCYTFIHRSQQLYLAAQYLYLLISESSEGADILHDQIKPKIFPSHTEQLVQFQPVLLYVLSTVVAGQATQDTTDQLEHTVRVLVQLLSRFSTCDWLEVVQYSAYSRLVAKEVSGVMSDIWTVDEHRVRAAIALMGFTTPRLITLNIIVDIEKVRELRHLLDMVAKRSCDVSLELQSMQYHDQVLDILCDPCAVCSVVNFQGNLSVEGYHHLGRMKKLRNLTLLILSQDVLERLMMVVGHLSELEELILCFTMEDIRPPEVGSVPPHIKLCVSLTHIKCNVIKAVDALRKISGKYETLIVSIEKGDTALRFVKKLQQREVEVKQLLRYCRINTSHFSGKFIVPYGPLPLRYPLHHFRTLWDEPPLVYSSRGGEVNINIKVDLSIEPLLRVT